MEPWRVSRIQCRTWGKLSMFSTLPAAFVTLSSFRIDQRHLQTWAGKFWLCLLFENYWLGGGEPLKTSSEGMFFHLSHKIWSHFCSLSTRLITILSSHPAAHPFGQGMEEALLPTARTWLNFSKRIQDTLTILILVSFNLLCVHLCVGFALLQSECLTVGQVSCSPLTCTHLQHPAFQLLGSCGCSKWHSFLM